MPKFVDRSPSQGLLLPPDMREWVPEDDLARFVLEAVESFAVNARGTGSAQYHPRTMLALLVYAHANGVWVAAGGAVDVPGRWREVSDGRRASGPRHDLQVQAEIE